METSTSGSSRSCARRASSSRRTPCMLMRSKVSVTVVINALGLRPNSARSARRASAESLPPLQERASEASVFFEIFGQCPQFVPLRAVPEPISARVFYGLQLNPACRELHQDLDDCLRAHHLPHAQVNLNLAALLLELWSVEAIDLRHAPARRLGGEARTSKVLAKILYEIGLGKSNQHGRRASRILTHLACQGGPQ